MEEILWVKPSQHHPECFHHDDGDEEEHLPFRARIAKSLAKPSIEIQVEEGGKRPHIILIRCDPSSESSESSCCQHHRWSEQLLMQYSGKRGQASRQKPRHRSAQDSSK